MTQAQLDARGKVGMKAYRVAQPDWYAANDPAGAGPFLESGTVVSGGGRLGISPDRRGGISQGWTLAPWEFDAKAACRQALRRHAAWRKKLTELVTSVGVPTPTYTPEALDA